VEQPWRSILALAKAVKIRQAKKILRKADDTCDRWGTYRPYRWGTYFEAARALLRRHVKVADLPEHIGHEIHEGICVTCYMKDKEAP
jgi:hypothetical protein